ncbi:uncharacterized protein LOC129872460 [Solanum dulcamara]|uniref:uncharacterized protein LOC129872460 n=1 Tax=Solanum dulcamara TaxID=45834 RepID=UPI002486669C|nr:uncharacterized protein LOC129872460 [Solanum dulcamara]
MLVEIQPPWKIYFDGSSYREGPGTGVVFFTSYGEVLLYSLALTLHCSNNIAEYQALLLGVEIAIDMNGHLYFLVATEYFTKWEEAISLREVKKENVPNFIRVNIIYYFNIRRYILIDNGKPFDNKLMTKICDLFCFKQQNSSMYYAAANGLTEAFNKALFILLKKVVSKSKRDWYEIMGEALWEYRTTYHMPIQETPYSLIYGVEVVLPLKCPIPLLRLAI